MESNGAIHNNLTLSRTKTGPPLLLVGKLFLFLLFSNQTTGTNLLSIFGVFIRRHFGDLESLRAQRLRSWVQDLEKHPFGFVNVPSCSFWTNQQAAPSCDLYIAVSGISNTGWKA